MMAALVQAVLLMGLSDRPRPVVLPYFSVLFYEMVRQSQPNNLRWLSVVLFCSELPHHKLSEFRLIVSSRSILTNRTCACPLECGYTNTNHMLPTLIRFFCTKDLIHTLHSDCCGAVALSVGMNLKPYFGPILRIKETDPVSFFGRWGLASVSLCPCRPLLLSPHLGSLLMAKRRLCLHALITSDTHSERNYQMRGSDWLTSGSDLCWIHCLCCQAFQNHGCSSLM